MRRCSGVILSGGGGGGGGGGGFGAPVSALTIDTGGTSLTPCGVVIPRNPTPRARKFATARAVAITLFLILSPDDKMFAKSSQRGRIPAEVIGGNGVSPRSIERSGKKMNSSGTNVLIIHQMMKITVITAIILKNIPFKAKFSNHHSVCVTTNGSRPSPNRSGKMNQRPI